MKIDLQLVDKESFMMHEHLVNGEMLTLIQPNHIGTKWNQNNKHLRSSVWNFDGELVSAGFPKFVNWGENPEHFPVPKNIKNAKFIQKVDGSLLIVSKYKGNFIFRTRGTLDATLMEKNGHEIQMFESEILSIIANKDLNDTWDYSILFEWCSPLNRIVILYPDIQWYLVGIINHSDYSLKTQYELDTFAATNNLLRPPSYKYDDVSTFENIIGEVDLWKGIEGLVIYSNNDQTMHKIKSADYLARHRLKSELGSFEKLIDFWVNVGKPEVYQDFYNEVSNLTDWETAVEHQGNISRIIDAYKDVKKIVSGMGVFVDDTLKKLPSRKEQAQRILSSYGQTNRAAFVFKLLDGKLLEDDDEKKLLYQCLKK